MKFLITSFLVVAFYCSYSQMERPYIPPSPNASAIARSASIQVGHYTGVPDINVPFYDLPGREMNIPISINYNASGIRVADVSSSVGIGWDLNAGGAVTRVVRWLPDGIEPNCTTDVTGKIATNQMYWLNFEDCDGETGQTHLNLQN